MHVFVVSAQGVPVLVLPGVSPWGPRALGFGSPELEGFGLSAWDAMFMRVFCWELLQVFHC